MRLLAQCVGMLLLIGFVGAYFWWIVSVAAVVLLVWASAKVIPAPRKQLSRPGIIPWVRRGLAH
jgi:hypothetical protein